MAEKLRFVVVELGGKTATGLQVPDGVVRALGPGKRPAVGVTDGGHTYRTTVAPMGGQFWVPLSPENPPSGGCRRRRAGRRHRRSRHRSP